MVSRMIGQFGEDSEARGAEEIHITHVEHEAL